MGEIIGEVQRADFHFWVNIPEGLVPEIEQLPFELGELAVEREMQGITYIYGGGGVTIVDGVPVPRTGISGRVLPEEGLFIPIDLRLKAVLREGVWVPITETPLLTVTKWSNRRWRAGIPKKIRVKYVLVPDEPVLLSYSKYAESWEEFEDIKKWRKVGKKVPVLYVNHDGEGYEAAWVDDHWEWVVPSFMIEQEGIRTAMEMGGEPEVEAHFNRDTKYLDVDFIIRPGFSDKRVAMQRGGCYRNMAVRNYTIKPEMLDDPDADASVRLAPFLLEIRATFLTTPKKTFIQDDSHTVHMDILKALNITVYNMFAYFFFRQAPSGIWYNPLFSDKFDEATQETQDAFTLEWDNDEYADNKGEIVETMGEEENVEVSYGEAAEFPFGYCYKYVRIINMASHQGRKRKPYIYTNKKIERKMRGMREYVWVDKNGFLWKA
jgi:hypothetical protein